jgi:hypothetical protein
MYLKATLVTMVSKYFEYGGIKMGEDFKVSSHLQVTVWIMGFKDVREGINFLD